MAKLNKSTVANSKGQEYEYYRLRRKVGMSRNKDGLLVPKYKSFYGKTQKEAQEKFEAYIKTGSLNSSACFGEFMDSYINNTFLPNSNLKDSTKTIYINAYLSTFQDAALLGASIDDITGADLQRVISSATTAPTTIRQSVKLVRMFYKYLETQHIARDITGGLVLPAVEHKHTTQDIETFTNEEIQLFLSKMPEKHRLRLLIILAINTGARIAELLALTYDDISNCMMRVNKSLTEIEPLKGSNGKTIVEITSTKTESSVRSIPLKSEVMDAVSFHKAWHYKEMLKNGYRTNYIFTTSTGNLYYKSTLRKSYSRLCKNVGVEPRGFHAFRRTFGTRLAENGVPIQTVSKLMGHTDITVTMQYYINISTNEKMAAINALNW